MRLYADNTLRISGAAMAKIVVTLSGSKDQKARYTTFSPSTGKLDPAQATGDTTITWVGNATDVTFTVGHNADFGDGAGKRGQIRFTKIEIFPAK